MSSGRERRPSHASFCMRTQTGDEVSSIHVKRVGKIKHSGEGGVALTQLDHRQEGLGEGLFLGALRLAETQFESSLAHPLPEFGESRRPPQRGAIFT